jgi:tRNA dimethylallyltransferase
VSFPPSGAAATSADLGPKLLVLAGPTGSGKSDLALATAEALGAEIVNADSVACYRGLDIGSAKPSPADQARVPHRLLDVVDPDQPFSAADYATLARSAVEAAARRGRPALAVGGTGLYIRSLVKGLFAGPGRDDAFRAELRAQAAAGVDLHALLRRRDPAAAVRLAPGDRARIERALEVFHLTGESIVAHQSRHGLAERFFRVLTVVVDRPVEELDERLRRRTKGMFEAGLVEETAGLLARGYDRSLPPMRSVGYLECLRLLAGELTRPEAEAAVQLRTRQLAKRQRTWFRNQSPEALRLPPEPEPLLKLARDFWAS